FTCPPPRSARRGAAPSPSRRSRSLQSYAASAGQDLGLLCLELSIGQDPLITQLAELGEALELVVHVLALRLRGRRGVLLLRRRGVLLLLLLVLLLLVGLGVRLVLPATCLAS